MARESRTANDRASACSKTRRSLLLILLLSGCLPEAGFMARCVGVTDGDTITVLVGADRTRIRLEGVDAPERGQPFSNRSRRFVSSLIWNREVQVFPREKDRYGRLVARVRVDGQDLSLALVQAGLAWHYKRYSSDPGLAAAELQARAKRLGLWSVADPMPPWEMKRRNREKPNLH